MEPTTELQSNMTPEQIDDMLLQLRTIVSRKRQLIDEYNRKLQSSPTLRKEVKYQKPSRLSSSAYRRSPERFFWTLEGKSAIRFKTPIGKPCFICNEKSNIEIVDKYGIYTCCTKHGKILSNRLGIHIEGMTEKEQKGELDDMSVEEIQALLDRLYQQLSKSKEAKLERNNKQDT